MFNLLKKNEYNWALDWYMWCVSGCKFGGGGMSDANKMLATTVTTADFAAIAAAHWKSTPTANHKHMPVA